MATVKKNTTRKATVRKAPVTGLPANVLKALKGTEKNAKQSVTDWRAAGSKIDLEHAPSLVAAAVRIATAPHGSAMLEAGKVGITESNEASRFAGAWKASLAFSARNGIDATAAFPTFFVMAKNVSNGDMLTIARSTSSLEAATLAGKSNRAARVATVKARKASGSVLNATGTVKASDGKTGNAHGGTGDTSAAKNGDTGDVVSDTLASAIRSVTRRVSDALEAGTLTGDDIRALGALEAVTLKVKNAHAAKVKAAKVTAETKVAKPINR